MRAEDLKINNYVLINGNPYQLTGFDIYKADESECLDMKPIELSEKLLLKCNVLQGNTEPNNNFDYFIPISAAKLYVRVCCGKLYFQFNETYLGEHFEFLHQLQNFYYSISRGKELEVIL